MNECVNKNRKYLYFLTFYKAAKYVTKKEKSFRNNQQDATMY
jgi:hypothetical protein